MKSNLKKYIPYILVYLIIFVILFLQHNVVHMYYDDFGNASLSYSTTVKNVVGTDYTFKQLIDEAISTYFNFGGRILYGLIVTLLLKHGIKAFMMTQIFIIMGIFYMISSIVTKITKKESYIWPVLCMILYMLMDITIMRHGVYWASASILYLWPLLPFLALINYYIKNNELIKKGEKINYLKYIVINIPLIIFTIFSQEQIGVGFIAFLIFYILFDHIKDIKKFIKYDLFTLIFSIITYLFLFLAPGNYARMEYHNGDFVNLSFFEKINLNIPKVFDLLFKVKGSIYINILISLILIYMVNKLIKSYKKNKKYLLLLPIVGMIIAYVLYDQQYYNYPRRLALIGFIILLSLFVSLFLYYKENKTLRYLSISIGAAASVFCLLMSPYMMERCVIPCIFIMFIPIISIGYDLYKKNKTFKTLVIILLLLCLYYGINNYRSIYLGYKNNDPINKDNYYKLEHYKKYSHDNNLELCKVNNSLYGSTQPYEGDFDYWIKEYFNIPTNIEMEWIDCNNQE